VLSILSRFSLLSLVVFQVLRTAQLAEHHRPFDVVDLHRVFDPFQYRFSGPA
jgi:hypothetical protein